jgi:hypothetical protein
MKEHNIGQNWLNPRKREDEQTTMSLDEFETDPYPEKGRGIKPKSNRSPRKPLHR